MKPASQTVPGPSSPCNSRPALETVAGAVDDRPMRAFDGGLGMLIAGN
jgi:hypothetical protein